MKLVYWETINGKNPFRILYHNELFEEKMLRPILELDMHLQPLENAQPSSVSGQTDNNLARNINVSAGTNGGRSPGKAPSTLVKRNAGNPLKLRIKRECVNNQQNDNGNVLDEGGGGMMGGGNQKKNDVAEQVTRIDCPCGNNVDNNTPMFQCLGHRCGIWQHSRCVQGIIGMVSRGVPKPALCYKCRVEMADPFYKQASDNILKDCLIKAVQQHRTRVRERRR